MTAKIDTSVRAAPPVVLPITTSPSPQPQASAEERRRALEERLARWKAISEAGGIDPWVQAQLTAKGALVTGDPARMCVLA